MMAKITTMGIVTASSRDMEGPVWAGISLGPPEQARGPHQQDDGGDKIEYCELDLGEELDAGSAHEADNERADEGTFQAPQPSNHHHDERQNERLYSHTEHGCLRRHDHRAAEPR